MAEFLDVMMTMKRICDDTTASGSGCSYCVLKGKWCASAGEPEIMKESERIVMQWAEEHPEPKLVYPTFAEWQKEMFPVGRSAMMPCMFRYITDSVCRERSCQDCAKTERIPPDVAEKLGIKPRLENG